ncbi:hypothetical protein [Methylobacterium isbiliense]|jgi:hypothetical protein|uniref:Uncharacterized protein n=1 Tax=Methylobacterium isbiliense TaxID=315478 RepID=A0ABQ4SHY3_9HYPH|nr:hypothetical protein [Methylobacterium isbiliense]MDN3623936.1 hypothetical protein [Methylobacterium isbiliense]GJE02789.1 hypothetical protein GMJLKIPL_4738 [Methylobacterium isbiliense]
MRRSPHSRQAAPKRSVSRGSVVLIVLGAVVGIAGIYFASQDFFGR